MYRVTYTRLDDRHYVGCRGSSFFHTENATAKFLRELEQAYNIDHDSIVIRVLDGAGGEAQALTQTLTQLG